MAVYAEFDSDHSGSFWQLVRRKRGMSKIVIDISEVGEYYGSGVPSQARLYANRDFTDSDGVFIAKGSDSNPNFYQPFTCSLVSNRIRIASGDVFCTTNALDDDGLSDYSLVIYDADGRKLKTLLTKLRVPHDGLNPITWAQLEAYSSGRRQKFPSTYLSSSAILAILAGYVNAAAKATRIALGLVKLDVDPIDINSPVVTGNNSPVLTNPATTSVIGHAFPDVAPVDPARPEFLGSNSPIVGIVNNLAGSSTTRKYRKAYASFLAAKTAATGGELVFDMEEAIAADSDIGADVLTALEGNGIFNIAATRTLAIKNAYSWGDRRIAKGQGKLVQHNGAVINSVNYSGTPYETTLNGAINSAVTTMTLTDASGYQSAPFVLCIDNEMIHVGAVAGNVCSSLTRGYDGTTAASHSNGAGTFIGLAANQYDGMKSSASIMGGGVIVLAPGKWGFAGLFDLVTGVTLAGCGGDIDGNGGTILKFLKNAGYGVKVGNNVKDVHFDNITFDAIGTTGNTLIRISGPNGTNISHASFTYCRFNDGDYGVNVYDETPSAFGALVLGVKFDLCWFTSQKIACFRSNTVNGSNEFNLCQFTPTPNTTSVCLDLDYAGPTVSTLCTYNGFNSTPQTIHTNIASINTTTNLITTTGDHGLTVGELELVTLRCAQAMTNTVVAPAGITTNGNARMVINAVGFNGATYGAPVPRTVTAALTTATHTTATLIATALRAALNADGVVTAFFTVGGTGAEITLSKITLNDNDSTMNFTIEDVTSVGITDDLTSSVFTGNLPAGTVNINRTTSPDVVNLHQLQAFFRPLTSTTGYLYLNRLNAFVVDEDQYRYNFTTSGIGTVQLRTNSPVRTGRPYTVLKAQNTITGIKFIGCQSEGFPYEAVIDNTYEKQKAIGWDTCLLQGIIKARSRCMISLVDSWAPANILSDLRTASVATDATAEVRNCSIHYDGVIGGNKDLGNTLVSNPTHNGFVGNSQITSMTGPDFTENADMIHGLTTIGSELNAYDLPIHEFTRDRPFFGRTGLRLGLKEPWEKRALKIFFDFNILDDLPAPTYPHTLRHLHIKPNNEAPLAERGVFIDAQLTHRGRLINVHAEALTSVSNVTPLDVTKAEYYFLDGLAEDTQINLTGTIIGGDTKKIRVEATSTNRFVGLGNGILKPTPAGFNTGSIPGFWTITLESWGGTFYFMELEFNPSSGDGSKQRGMPRVLVLGTTKQMVPNVHYIVQNAGLCTLTLPVKMNIGDRVSVKGSGPGGWKIAQNASQLITLNEGGVVGTNLTTTGTGGFLSSVDDWAAVELECQTADTLLSPLSVYPALASVDPT